MGAGTGWRLLPCIGNKYSGWCIHELYAIPANVCDGVVVRLAQKGQGSFPKGFYNNSPIRFSAVTTQVASILVRSCLTVSTHCLQPSTTELRAVGFTSVGNGFGTQQMAEFHFCGGKNAYETDNKQ